MARSVSTRVGRGSARAASAAAPRGTNTTANAQAATSPSKAPRLERASAETATMSTTQTRR